MKLVTRSDGMVINLSSAIAFMPKDNDMIVEYSNGEYFIITNFGGDDLYGNHSVRREFRGWPENKK